MNEDEDEGEDANVDGEEEQPQQQGPPRPVLRLRRVAARLGRELAAPAHFTQQQLLHLAEEALGMQVTEAVTRELSSPDWSQSATAGSFWGMLLLLLFHAAPSGGSGPARLLRKLWAASVSTSVEEATEAPTQHAGSQQAAGAAGAAGLVLDRCVLREFVCAVLVLLRYEEVSGMLAPLGYGEPYAVLHGAVLEVGDWGARQGSGRKWEMVGVSWHKKLGQEQGHRGKSSGGLTKRCTRLPARCCIGAGP